MRISRLLVAALMVAVFVVGVRWGTFAVGGSDSSCYVIQARNWARFQLQEPQPLALAAPWPGALASFAVTGHVASPTVRGAMVPICASGLSMLMALVSRLGDGTALFLVVPLFGAVLIGAVYALGERVSSHVGLAAAVLTAMSPVFLFQLVQPMSDVPAAALWCTAAALMSSTWRRSALTAGLVTSLAILVRPNLLPLGIAMGVLSLAGPSGTIRSRVKAAVAYAVGSVPGCLAVGLINQYFYGSPLSSGYGSAQGLFALVNVGPNFRHYFTWTWDTTTPVFLLGFLAPLIRRGWLTCSCAALVLVNLACYLPYVVFEEWSYLRFLLPTLPLVLLLAVITLDLLFGRVVQIGRRMAEPMQRMAALGLLAVTTLVLTAGMARTAVERHVFALATLESRFVRAGRAVADRLPRNAAVVTAMESGSVTYYSGRLTVAWDQIDPDSLDSALAYLRDRDREPYLLFERGEEPGFRRRFQRSDLGRLDWPPAIEIGGQVRVYRPGDRARYFSGTSIKTDYVR